MNSIRRHAFNCPSALLILIVLVGSVGQMFSQEANGISPKLRWLEEHKDNFDIVFIGSSRVYHGVSPKIFDQVTAQTGHQWRSFNLGMDRMGMAPSFEIIRQLVALGPRKLKYIFFELQAGTGVGAPKRDNSVEEGDANSHASFEMVQRIALHDGLGPDGDGFFPMARPMTAQVLPIYRQRLQAEKAHPVQRQPNPIVRSDLSRFYQEMTAKNIQVVFIVAPSLRSARGSGINAPPDSLLFSFDELVRYAPLYEEENRMDGEHLNARGADVFSRILAREFVAAVDSKVR